MLIAKIVATVMLGITALASFLVCCAVFSSNRHCFRDTALGILGCLTWFAYIIVVIWII
jgi:hypothetical protein